MRYTTASNNRNLQYFLFRVDTTSYATEEINSPKTFIHKFNDKNTYGEFSADIAMQFYPLKQRNYNSMYDLRWYVNISTYIKGNKSISDIQIGCGC